MITESKEFVNLNGELCSSSSASVGIWNGGTQYGYGLFETLRTYGSVFFAWSEHYQRMALGCRSLHMNLPFSEKEGLEQLEKLQNCYFEHGEKEDAVFRVTVTPSSIKNWNLGKTMYIITRRPIPDLTSKQVNGVPVAVLTTPRSSSATAARIKGISFTDIVLARQEMRSYNLPTGEACEEGLMLNEAGRIVEATCSNVFFVFRESVTGAPTLVTPPESDGPLLGITRRHVLQIAEHLQIPVLERSVFANDIIRAEEIFLTNAVQELVPVSTVVQNGRNLYTMWESGAPCMPYARDKSGTITQQILQRYKQFIILKK